MVTIPKKTLNDGNEIPVLGLGTWQMEKDACLKSIPKALELGYRAIDTAYAYYNEKFIGEAIEDFPREKLFITSKLWREFHEPKKVEKICNTSLKDLGTDYLDLYLIHWPEKKNMVEILEQMHRLKEKGKVKSVGISNATVGHLRELIKQKVPISNNQVEFHPFLNQTRLLNFCDENHITVTAYSPIAQGTVTNELTLVEIGKKHNKTPPQVSLRWLLQKGIIVIPKAFSKAHLKENLDVFNFSLTVDEMERIDAIDRNHRMVLPEFHEFHD